MPSRESTDESRGDLRALQEGDRDALERMVVRHLPALKAYVRLHRHRLLEAREADTDILQSACREILGDLGRVEYRSEGHFRNWLYAMTLRKIRDKLRYWRAEKRDPMLLHPPMPERSPLPSPTAADFLALYAREDSPSEGAAAREALQSFEAAFARLSDDGRAVVLLYRVCGMTYPEIAAELGKSEAAVRQIYARSAARLLRILRPH